jgi:plastocyanin
LKLFLKVPLFNSILVNTRQFLLFASIFGILSSCDNHVEDEELSPCETGNTIHEIIWKIGVNGESASLIINTGDTVRWIWEENDIPHTVSSEDANAPADFGSELLTGEGSIYEYTFTEEIHFEYLCSVHPATMFGSITVINCDGG